MISIIGAGRVGSAVAFLAAQNGLDDIVLVNRTKNKAVGEELDLVSTIPGKSLISVTGTDDISKIKNSDVIVIAVGGGVIKEERIDLLPFTAPVISEICKNLRKYADEAKIVVVTNPVDIITYQIIKQTEFPRERVFGIGSSLDSSRLRYLIAKKLGVKQGEIDGFVIGEHGPTMVPLFSHAKSRGEKIIFSEKIMLELASEVQNYWRSLISFKGASVFGAAKNTFDIVKSIVDDKELLAPVSVYLKGEYGFSDISMGVPVVFGKDGMKDIVKLSLSQTESELLHLSAKRIHDGIARLLNIVK